MYLKFLKPHLSISQFDSIEVPKFMVLTGVNGSGKSHLLQAIENKCVGFAGLENAHIVRFNYETFRLENEQSFNAQQLASERDATWNLYQNQVKPNAKNWRGSLGGGYVQIKTTCETEKKSLWKIAGDSIKSYKSQVKSFFTQSGFKQNQQIQGLYSLAKELPCTLDEMERKDFDRLYKPIVLKNDFLPHQLGKVFWDYYVKYHRNQFSEFQSCKSGIDHGFLTEAEFFVEYGGKPWDVVNKVLEKFDTLAYKVNSPEGFDYFGNFKLKLIHIEKNGLEIEFDNLSSGEKILMALVASVYKSSSDKTFPDILLLDEVDASLHPSMMKNMLEVIQDVFIKQGVRVVLVTHSPTTIALAPEESVFVMNRSGNNRIEKKSKQDALGILTQGFATLESGLRLFDEVAKSELTLITEGNNTLLIERALKLYGICGVNVLSGIEGVSGKNQLRTLFDFFSKASHRNKVIFVFDCDVSFSLNFSNNTYPYIFPRNDSNVIAKKGIENMFSAHLFEQFKKVTTLSTGEVIEEFDGGRKRDFEQYILSRNALDDFNNFISLINEIKRIKEH